MCPPDFPIFFIFFYYFSFAFSTCNLFPKLTQFGVKTVTSTTLLTRQVMVACSVCLLFRNPERLMFNNSLVCLCGVTLYKITSYPFDMHRTGCVRAETTMGLFLIMMMSLLIIFVGFSSPMLGCLCVCGLEW